MKKRAFTLIELLVVIAIIGLLSAVVLASLNSARAKGRDTTRKETLVQVRNALELYRTANGSYPTSGLSDGLLHPQSCDPATTPTPFGGDCLGGLIGNYYKSTPKDPNYGLSSNDICSGQRREYIYISDGSNYKFMASCSPEAAVGSYTFINPYGRELTYYLSPNDVFYDPQHPSTNWMVTSKPGIPSRAEAGGNNDQDFCNWANVEDKFDYPACW